jgi:hypothetical protein
MKVRCTSPFEPKLYKGTLYTIESFTKDGFLKLKELPDDEWKASRFIPVKRNELDITIYPVIKNAKSIEEVICLSSLIAAKLIPDNSTMETIDIWLEKHEDCNNCPLIKICLAERINE